MNKHGFPNWLSVAIMSILTLGISIIVISIISNTVGQIVESGPEIVRKVSTKLEIFVVWLNSLTPYHFDMDNIKNTSMSLLTGEWITGSLGSLFSFVGSFTGSFLIFALYFVILLASFGNYERYILYVGGKENGQQFLFTFEKVMESITTYMNIKFFVSAVTGILFWVICTLFGIKFAMFWGFMTFALNFIPNIGSVFATFPPILLGIIHFDSSFLMIFFSILLISVQMIIGNVIEPYLTGNRLRLNIIIVIFGLLFWGYIWGIVGALLAVPLLVLVRVILEQYPGTRIIARLMGTKEAFNETKSPESSSQSRKRRSK